MLEVRCEKKLAKVKRRITALKTQLEEAQVKLEKLTGESTRTNADLWAQVVAVEKALTVERARVERLEREVSAET